MLRAKIGCVVVALLVLQACQDPERYPISGEECTPDDPVLDLTVENCAPPA